MMSVFAYRVKRTVRRNFGRFFWAAGYLSGYAFNRFKEGRSSGTFDARYDEPGRRHG